MLGAAGLGIGTATGVITLTGTAASVFLASLGWFLLGFLFFAMRYAAAGALVSRQEELNAVTTPMTLLTLAPFFVAIYSLQSPGGLGLTVLAVALMLATTAVFTWLGGRVYAGAVLRSGSRVRVKDALHTS